MQNQNRFLFISHASADKPLASELKSLLEQALDVRGTIRCTSAPGGGLLIGNSPSDQLREELKESCVVALLTKQSITSPWVLFELGAAWGNGRPVLPVTCGVKPDELPAALQGAIFVNAADVENVGNLVDQLEDHMGWKRRSTQIVNAATQRFVAFSQTQSTDPAHQLLNRREVMTKLRWGDVAQRTQSELFIWGWSGVAALNERTRNTLLKMLADGKKIRFLILSPAAVAAASEHLDFGPVCSWDDDEIRKDVEKGRKALLDFRASLPEQDRASFEARETRWVMTWSGLAIDPTSNNGLIQAESYLYKFGMVEPDHTDFRPNLLMTPKSPFYRGYAHSLAELWKSAQPLV